MERRLRVGVIAYANVAPLFHGVRREPVEFVPGVPTELNDWLLTGAVDVALVSTAHWARHTDRLERIGPVGIASRGAVRSVILSCERPPDRFVGPIPFQATPSSATSVALLEILARHHWSWGQRLHPRSSPVDAPVRLLIGDEALRESHDPGPRHLLDLGAEWLDYTGGPMVWAVLCRRRRPDAAGGRDLDGFVARLKTCAGNPQREQVIESIAANLGLPPDLLRSYFDNIRYVLGPSEEASLARFVTLTSERSHLYTRRAVQAGASRL